MRQRVIAEWIEVARVSVPVRGMDCVLLLVTVLLTLMVSVPVRGMDCVTYITFYSRKAAVSVPVRGMDCVAE